MSKKTQISTLISLKELASQLSIADALLKKYIRDFEIPTEKVKNRAHLEESNVDVIKEIIRLKDAGKTANDIKAILQHVRKQEQQSTQAEPVSKDNKKASKPNAAEASKRGRKPKDKTAETSSKASQAAKPEPVVKEEKKPEVTTAKQEEKAVSEKPQTQEKPAQQKTENKQKQAEQNVADEFAIDVADYLREEAVEQETLDGPTMVEAIEEEIGELPDGEDEEELEEELDDRDAESHKGVRRKAFNFRYVQRQIANDSRRVNFIKHRLQKTNISMTERLQLEESLDKRAKLLSGWLHILRWIKSRSSKR